MDREDYLIWMPFDSLVYPAVQGKKSEIGEELIKRIGGTTANGGTALYDAVGAAYETLDARRKLQGDTVRYGIVVLSDGDDTSSGKFSLAQLEGLLKPDEINAYGIRVHTIGVGEANTEVLCRLAPTNLGKCWKVKETKVLAAVYREIVKYF